MIDNSWPTVSLREFEGTDVTLINILHRYRLTDEQFNTDSLELCARYSQFIKYKLVNLTNKTKNLIEYDMINNIN